ncbi:hypothetical protein ABID14_000247 [Peptoniphilus olsenii]|uniref:Uncharacterized protein n=1 Tax=Peptoniphilus olsenii TaxID=411570 RepID=A0ABV2J775_9FIRM
MELNIEYCFEEIDEIKELVRKISEIEKEYSCNCTLKLIRITPCPDFQEFYKLPQ